MFKLLNSPKSRHYLPDLAKALKNDKAEPTEPLPKKKGKRGGSAKPKRKSRGKGRRRHQKQTWAKKRTTCYIGSYMFNHSMTTTMTSNCWRLFGCQDEEEASDDDDKSEPNDDDGDDEEEEDSM